MAGYMYILECSNGLYYVGSTRYLKARIAEHQQGIGSNFTKKHLPVRLAYYEKFKRIDDAFSREKQVQGWSRKKKEALMNSQHLDLHLFAECMNSSHFENFIGGGFEEEE